MTELTLKKLIPIAGERLDFMEHLRLYKEKNTEHIATFTIPVIEDATAITDVSFDANTTTQADIASDQSETSSSCIQDELSDPSTSQITILNEPVQKRQRIQNNSYDLLALLESTTSGRMILAYFNTHACLNDDMHKLLANEIINNKLSNNVHARMQNERVEFLIQEIIKCFPSEIEVIWKGAFGDNHRETSIGRGKLLRRYYNIRRKLRKCGVLKQELKHATEDSVSSEMEWDEDFASDNIQ
ncbi:PREDICTED: uncharacterized protein LOC105447831 [Wasmannia auropunctata]|uniref:uncharacterized protein LOC105447831 n=1 Tax=Wasmannia auropunctata TaxID=64793 RepID=UPI0005EF8AF9|nr:PREDICTED: uncharacterized protein LOC105447831 [Wasmannia auropunctata]XP_011684357.1 PREDICTED: uncharacterized protein LOC105447831 [Wasmannia auropunctata]